MSAIAFTRRCELLRASKDGRKHRAEHHPSRRGQVAAPQDDGSGVSRPARGRQSNMTPRSRDSIRPSFANSFAPKERGRREDRVRAAPAISCAKAEKKDAHEHTGSAEAVRPSLRNGFTAYFVLSPARPGLFATVAPKKRELLKNLTPAIGASGPHVLINGLGGTRWD
jgi:hypothetical protein